MATFVFLSGRHCNDPISNYNMTQILKYYHAGMNYFTNMYERALETNDNDRIIYYADCLDIFSAQKDIEKTSETMNATQKSRLRDTTFTTIDNLVC